MITALLVDDEPKALDRLAELLEDCETVEVIGRARSVDEAERFLSGRRPDVVFLDITMPGRLGVDLLASVPPGTKVVFVTARENYAVEAFRDGAVDYILKPFDRDRLLVTVERLENLLATTDEPKAREPGLLPAAADAGAQEGEVSDADNAVVKLFGRGGRLLKVPYADILWIEAVQNYTRVQVTGAEPTVVRRTMGEWEAMLPESFARISRSLFVNLDKIRSTQWQSRDQMLVFFSGVEEPLPIGRTPMARLKELLSQR